MAGAAVKQSGAGQPAAAPKCGRIRPSSRRALRGGQALWTLCPRSPRRFVGRKRRSSCWARGPRIPIVLHEATGRIASEVRQQGLKRLPLAVGATYRPGSMTARRALILFLASFEGLWMAFDGVRALFVGSFITPSAGPYAGEVGPWRVFFEAVNVEPNGVAVHVLFAGYGIVWLVIAAGLRGQTPVVLACDDRGGSRVPLVSAVRHTCQRDSSRAALRLAGSRDVTEIIDNQDLSASSCVAVATQTASQ